MGDIPEEHMGWIAEDYFFGEADPYDDEDPINRMRVDVNEMYPLGGFLAGTPTERIYQAEQRVNAGEENYRRLLRSPFRDDDRWAQGRGSVAIRKMSDSHVSNSCNWIIKNMKRRPILWWSLLRFEFELLHRGVTRTGMEHLIPALEQHQSRCRNFGWAPSEIEWQDREISGIVGRNVSMQE